MKIQKINDLRGTKGSQLMNKIFVVHGHDESVRESVARFLEKAGMEPIILHEQANAGNTIIEKFEHYSKGVGFAIVILTGDDIARALRSTDDTLTPRARQNVILELGFFIAKLGRNKVCVLYEDGVELPSDYQGILYTLIDSPGKWKFDLAKELRNAGYTIDMNHIT